MQLKNLIEKMSFNPDIDENYFARTEKNTENLFTPGVCHYILVFYIIGFFIAVTITVLMLWIYFNTNRWDEILIKLGKKPKLYIESKSKIFGIALTVGILMLYILVLDFIAVATMMDKIHILTDRNIDDKDLPFIVLLLDLLMAMIWGSCCIFSRCCKKVESDGVNIFKYRYLLLSISTVGPIFTLVTHLPYIVIAYLNDASYASSIFIYIWFPGVDL